MKRKAKRGLSKSGFLSPQLALRNHTIIFDLLTSKTSTINTYYFYQTCAFRLSVRR